MIMIPNNNLYLTDTYIQNTINDTISILNIPKNQLKQHISEIIRFSIEENELFQMIQCYYKIQTRLTKSTKYSLHYTNIIRIYKKFNLNYTDTKDMHTKLLNVCSESLKNLPNSYNKPKYTNNIIDFCESYIENQTTKLTKKKINSLMKDEV